MSSRRSVTALESYIVVLKSDSPDPAAFANAVVTPEGRVGHIYRRLLRGFSASLTSASAEALKKNPQVLRVNADPVYHADTAQSWDPLWPPPGVWGLERIDQREPAKLTNWKYEWYHNGAGVYAYIVDSGVDSNHVDFGGRAKNAFDALGGSGQDCHGHGTHVAGTVGSRSWGVAKGVNVRGVRVLNCQGGANASTIIAGLEWIAINRVNPAVANVSISGPYSQDLNDAIDSLAQSGVFVAVSAGNDNINACSVSPSSAPSAMTVAASRKFNPDHRAEYSNWGSCVDIYAPGSIIRSARLGGGYEDRSGTSMAAPHVAAVAAIYKSAFGDAASSVISNWITANATVGAISGNPAGTPNLLVYKAPSL